MYLTLTDSEIGLGLNIISAVSLILFVVAFHASINALDALRKTEEYYNQQPRVKKIRARLSWPARFISFLRLKK